MNHVHYDLTQAEASLRKLRAEVLPGILAGAKCEADLQLYLAQDALWEPLLLTHLGILRMVNEGRSAEFIGKALGAIMGNTVVNAASASRDSATTLPAVIEAWSRVISSALLDGEDAGVSINTVDVVGERGGRA